MLERSRAALWLAVVVGAWACDDGDGGGEGPAPDAGMAIDGGVGGAGGQDLDQGAAGAGGVGGMGGMGGIGGMGGGLGEGTCADPYLFRAWAAPMGNGFRAEGNAASAATHTGSCGGDGAEDVWLFEAPTAGAWSFSTADPRSVFDTVLYLRTTCDDPATELSCNDDGGDNGVLSATGAQLEAGQRVYIFVDAFMNPAGNYALLAQPINAPVLQAADALFNGSQLRLSIAGRDADADVLGFDLQLLDGDGAIIPLAGAAGDRLEGLEFAEPVFGQESFEAVALIEGLDAFPQTAAVRLAARRPRRDQRAQGHQAGPDPRGGRRRPCDPDGFRDRCAAGLVCSRPADPAAQGTCQAPAPRASSAASPYAKTISATCGSPPPIPTSTPSTWGDLHRRRGRARGAGARQLRGRPGPRARLRPPARVQHPRVPGVRLLRRGRPRRRPRPLHRLAANVQ
ncbi:MAG: hypothetical protein R3F43_24435 [bacterium]